MCIRDRFNRARAKEVSELARRRFAKACAKPEDGRCAALSGVLTQVLEAWSYVARVRRMHKNVVPSSSSKRSHACTLKNCSADDRPCRVSASESHKTILSGNGSAGMSGRHEPAARKSIRRDLVKLAKDDAKDCKLLRRPRYFLSFQRCHDSCACVPEADPGWIRCRPHHHSAV